MTQMMPDDLWREFPKTATEFEAPSGARTTRYRAATGRSRSSRRAPFMGSFLLSAFPCAASQFLPEIKLKLQNRDPIFFTLFIWCEYHHIILFSICRFSARILQATQHLNSN